MQSNLAHNCFLNIFIIHYTLRCTKIITEKKLPYTDASKTRKLLIIYFELKYVRKCIILLNIIYIIFQIVYKSSFTLLSCLFLL